jgi:hypothetical protein
MARVPGVVEDQHAARADAGGGIRDVAGKLARRDTGQTAIGVIQQRDTGHPELDGRLAQLGFARDANRPASDPAWMPRRG